MMNDVLSGRVPSDLDWLPDELMGGVPGATGAVLLSAWSRTTTCCFVSRARPETSAGGT
jgi:hypothetical protein